MSDSSPPRLPQVHLFTDGACAGNPGPGGWAFILRDPKSGRQLIRSGDARETTNNRMELTAVIRGLEALKRPCEVTLLADSVYVGKGLTQWMPKWKANGWRRREQGQWKPVKNEALWRRLDQLSEQHRVTFSHVTGHSGHPENEQCDKLAVAAYQKHLNSKH